MQLSIINKNNQVLDLLNNRDHFILYKADNTHGIDTDIASSDSPYFDGVEIDNVKALPRGIELGFKLVGDIKESIDFFTSIVKSKQFVTLREVENDRDLVIKGIATIQPYTRMLSACEISLQIYCGQPYWEDLNTIVEELSNNINMLYFPVDGQYFPVEGRPFGVIDTDLEKSFFNDGDVAIGFEISLTSLGVTPNIRIGCRSGEQSGNYMQLNLTLQPNDELYIKTTRNEKTILINGSSIYNGNPILSKLVFTGADWLQLETGENIFNLTSNGVDPAIQPIDVYFNLSYKRRFE